MCCGRAWRVAPHDVPVDHEELRNTLLLNEQTKLQSFTKLEPHPLLGHLALPHRRLLRRSTPTRIPVVTGLTAEQALDSIVCARASRVRRYATLESSATSGMLLAAGGLKLGVLPTPCDLLTI